MRQLAAQMQAVLGAIDPALLRLFHRVDHLLEIFQAVATVAHIANRHRVQHGGNAAGDHQRVVAAHRRVGGPVYLRARGEKLVEIVGMQLDKPWQQPAAFSVHRLGQLALTFGKGADRSALNFQRSLHHFIFQHQLYIIDNHAVVPIRCRRSATRSRTV